MYRRTGGTPPCLIHATRVNRDGARRGLVPALRTPLPVSAFPNRPEPSVSGTADVAVRSLPDESGVVFPGPDASRCHCPASGEAAWAVAAVLRRATSAATK